MLYNETKAFDKRSFNDGPFLAAGAGVLFVVLINGDKGIIYSDRNDVVLAKTYKYWSKNDFS
jgi:hypothetical protein